MLTLCLLYSGIGLCASAMVIENRADPSSSMLVLVTSTVTVAGYTPPAVSTTLDLPSQTGTPSFVTMPSPTTALWPSGTAGIGGPAPRQLRATNQGEYVIGYVLALAAIAKVSSATIQSRCSSG